MTSCLTAPRVGQTGRKEKDESLSRRNAERHRRDYQARTGEPRIIVRPPRRYSYRYRRRRLRIVYALLALALVALALTARCEAPGASAAAGVDNPPPHSPEAVSAAHSLPADAFQRCAVKALRGDYGPLQEWQRVAYQRGLDIGARQVRAWVTTYYPEEGFPRGQMCRWGYPVSERVAAANLLPARTFIWLPEAGVRQVLDTGARSNDAVAQRLGGSLWLDIWEPRRGLLFGDDNAGVRVIYIIERRP